MCIRDSYELSDVRLAHALDDLCGAILAVETVCFCDVPECPQ